MNIVEENLSFYKKIQFRKMRKIYGEHNSIHYIFGGRDVKGNIDILWSAAF